ncbi:hypothetical protein VIGAN_08273600 [Vigna angularis var. angularis]|uniref:Uncharacterized protein n=1 Tax=Vigna angularis var. angularis TaxID=157739 RepID=A0A0S3SSR1_PHAAN|nr:hypothetical protein VIGAN_08273600 [Vigna angularis var. angularis]
MDHFFSDFFDFPTTSTEHQFSRFKIESKPQIRSPHSETRPSNINLGFHVSEHTCPTVVAGVELEEGDGARAGRRGFKPSTASHRDLRFLLALCSKKRPVRWVKLLTKKRI